MKIRTKEGAEIWTYSGLEQPRVLTEQVLAYNPTLKQYEYYNDGAGGVCSLDFIKAHPEAFEIIEDEPKTSANELRIEELEKENKELKIKNRAYFDALDKIDCVATDIFGGSE